MAKTKEQLDNEVQKAEEKAARAAARVKKLKDQAKKFTEAKKRELDMEILAEAKKFCHVYLAYKGINEDINDQEKIIGLLKKMVEQYERKMAEAKGGAGGTPAER